MSPHFGIWQGFDVFRYWGEDSETLPTVEVTGGVSRALELVDEIGERPFFLSSILLRFIIRITPSHHTSGRSMTVLPIHDPLSRLEKWIDAR